MLGFSRKIDRNSSIDNLLIGKKKSKPKMYRATNYKKLRASRFRNGRLLRERRTLVFYALELRKTLQQLSHEKENQLAGSHCI